jgi:hypothetical protein
MFFGDGNASDYLKFKPRYVATQFYPNFLRRHVIEKIASFLLVGRNLVCGHAGELSYLLRSSLAWESKPDYMPSNFLASSTSAQ